MPKRKGKRVGTVGDLKTRAQPRQKQRRAEQVLRYFCRPLTAAIDSLATRHTNGARPVSNDGPLVTGRRPEPPRSAIHGEGHARQSEPHSMCHCARCSPVCREGRDGEVARAGSWRRIVIPLPPPPQAVGSGSRRQRGSSWDASAAHWQRHAKRYRPTRIVTSAEKQPRRRSYSLTNWPDRVALAGQRQQRAPSGGGGRDDPVQAA